MWLYIAGVPSSPVAPTASREQPRRDTGGSAGHARVLVVWPPALAGAHPVAPPGAVLGRATGGGLDLDHQTVSRRHLKISLSGALFTAEDLDSRHGSFVDAARLRGAAPLRDGAVVRLGDVVFVFEHGRPPDATAEVSAQAVPGDSRAARVLRLDLARAARDPAPVLLIGETGTGKESAAAELHRLSRRAGPYLTLNCAALSAQLVESQLFGHVKGAFTGADAAHDGLFRGADRGTLLLDEIGELPLDLQPKLLRALQEGEVLPVGSTRALDVDVRVIAATNRDLYAEVQQGRFRRDLYARLALFELRVPSLAQRRADVMVWLAQLLKRWATARGAKLPPLDVEPEGVEALLLARYDENLRTLDRVVHALAGSAARWTLEQLTPLLGAQAAAPPPGGIPTREELAEVLARLKSVRATAKHFGRERKQIYRWLEKHGLAPPANEGSGE